MDIWNVSDNLRTKLILWRNQDNVFSVVQDGEFTSLLTNPNYILIDKLIAPAFFNLSDKVAVTQVIIVDPSSDRVMSDYCELGIVREISPSTIQNMEANGKKIWRYGENVFVSGELKEAIRAICPEKFNFTEGFSHFGG